MVGLRMVVNKENYVFIFDFIIKYKKIYIIKNLYILKWFICYIKVLN